MGGGKETVILLGSIDHAKKELNALEEDFCLVDGHDVDNQDELLKRFNYDGQYSNARGLMFCGSRRVKVQWTPDFVAGLPQHLKFICSEGAGYDGFADIIDNLTKKGIQLSHTPGSVDDSTSTTATFLILCCMRRFYAAEKSIREKQWRKLAPPGHDPKDKVLGIVGFGGIGRSIARKMATAYGMRIVYFSRHRSDDEKLAPGISAEYCDTLDKLLDMSDVVSLSVPLTDSTRNLMSRQQFAKMKKGSILVNTARGGVVDEAALLETLDSGHLASAGLDVMVGEPNIDEKLFAQPNLVLLPHVGTWTEEAMMTMEQQVIANVRAGLETGKVIDLVAEQRGKL